MPISTNYSNKIISYYMTGSTAEDIWRKLFKGYTTQPFPFYELETFIQELHKSLSNDELKARDTAIKSLRIANIYTQIRVNKDRVEGITDLAVKYNIEQQKLKDELTFILAQ